MPFLPDAAGPALRGVARLMAYLFGTGVTDTIDCGVLNRESWSPSARRARSFSASS